MEKEINMNETSGRYSVKAKIDENDPLHDELSGFYLWFDSCKIADRLAELLHKKGYLTEGDLASIVGIESNLSNPFLFFYGDKKIWRFDLMNCDKYFSKRLKSIGPVEAAVENAVYVKAIIQIQQALED